MSEFNQRLLIVAGFILFLALIVELSPAQAHDTIGIAALCELADKHGNGVPPSLVVALIEEESGGQPDIVSSAGAVGLMQIIQRFHPGVDLTDPATNIDVGTHVLITDWLYLNHIRSGLQTAAEIDWSNSDWLGRSLRGYNMGSRQCRLVRSASRQADARSRDALCGQH